jgi:phosphatidylglycerophosphate synthase
VTAPTTTDKIIDSFLILVVCAAIIYELKYQAYVWSIILIIGIIVAAISSYSYYFENENEEPPLPEKWS